MAQIDIAQLVTEENKFEHVNISDVVGVGEANERNDVMLIQALFKLVGYSPYYAKLYFGMDKAELPEPTGDLDDKTVKAIWSFQKKTARRLLNIDGKIHPANYKDRVIKKPWERVMAITFLNMNAIDGALMEHNTDLISALKKIAPSLVLKQVSP
jgi:hypothetical protein